jgi:hypothetical protein
MKPVAPPLPAGDAETEQPSLESEIGRLCEARAAEERVTIPSPPSEEALRLSTPYPPADEEASTETTPAPRPVSMMRRTDGEPESEETPTTIPGPPPVPRIAGT